MTVIPHRPDAHRLTPILHGRSVVLRAVRPEDYGSLYALATDDRIGPTWRLRGATPDPDRFVSLLWAGVEAQFSVLARGTEQVRGLVSLYNVNHGDQYGHLAIMMDTDYRARGESFEAICLLLRYAFRSFNLRKVYADVPEFNVDTIGKHLDRYAHEEARLRSHSFYDGRYWDQVTMAIYRDDWAAIEERLDGLLRAQAEPILTSPS